MENGESRHGKSNKATITKGHVIANGKNGKKGAHTDIHDEKSSRRTFFHRHAFIITMMLSTMLDGIVFSVSGQYRYRFFHDKYRDELDQYNYTRGGKCASEDQDPHLKEIEDTITKETTKWNLYENYVTMVPLFIASLAIGMKSDQIGRRFLFLLSITSCGLFAISQALVIKLKVHVGWLLIGSFFLACTGGNITMFFASFALVSDTHGKKEAASTEITVTPDNHGVREKGNIQTSPKKNTEKEVDDEGDEMDAAREQTRTYKLVGLDVARKLSFSIVSFATGYIIKYAGFFYTMVLTIALRSLLFVFSFIFITETGQQKKSVDFKAPLRTIGRALKDPAKKTTLILCNFGLFFMVTGLVEEFEILRIYQMSPPFCFDAVHLGYFSSVGRLKGIFGMPLMWLWKRLHISEPSIAAIGLLSSAASALTLATIRQAWIFYAAPVISIPGTLSSAVAKAISSRLIGRSALASTFAVMIAGEEVFWFTGSISSNYLYQHYISTVPTAPFYLGAASFGVAALLFTILSVKQRRLRKREEEQATTDTKINTRL